MKILAIDDKKEILKEVVSILSDYDVTTAGDGVNGMQKLSRDSYDLILTDYNMPHMDGQQLILAIKGDEGVSREALLEGHMRYEDFEDAIKRHKEVPIIMMSAISIPDFFENITKIGVADTIQKRMEEPYLNKDELVGIIQKYEK